LSRPHIDGRARRAHLTPLAVGLTFGAALTVPSVTGAAVTATPPPPSPAQSTGISANPAISETAGIAAAPGIPAISDKVATHIKLRLRRVNLNVLLGSAATVSGTLRPALAGRVVYLQRLGRHGWRSLSHTLTGVRGRFTLHYAPHGLLSEPVRVMFAGGAGDLSVRRGVGRLTSYRLTVASWYGGGGSLACGGELTSATLGVANKTLPCGTLVTLRYGARSVRVPVVDRGPYVEGREFDLTEATKRALGFEGVGDVWSNR
jgi:rare lipoprotein A